MKLHEMTITDDTTLGELRRALLDPHNKLTPDDLVGLLSFHVQFVELWKLKHEPTPLPYGIAIKYSRLIPPNINSLQELYKTSANPFWWGYAYVTEQIKELLDGLPKQEFVEKKGKKK